MTGSEYSFSTRLGRGYIDTEFGVKAVEYFVIDGDAIFEGDIILGTDEELSATQQDSPFGGADPEEPGEQSRGLVISDERHRWPQGVIPYQIADNLPNKERVPFAIAHWEKHTPIRFVKRTNERNYVLFRPHSSQCSSRVGRVGNRQFVNLAEGCSANTTIHEIGHAVGLWHEQSRSDRDKYVKIFQENIIGKNLKNFEQHIRDGKDAGPYDYDSIMHYSAYAFAIDKSKPTIVPRQSGRKIGQRDRLSLGDVATVSIIYSGTLTAKHSNKAVDVAEESTEDGASIVQWSKSGGDNQRWKLEHAENGYYYIIFQHSGKVLDVSEGNTEDGASIVQWSKSGGDNQKWKLEDAGDGFYYLVAKHSGKVLDVAEGSTEDGATLIQWTKTGDDNQKWRINAPHRPSSSRTLEDGADDLVTAAV